MSALIALATSIGAPLVEKILAKKIGAANASLATEVVKEIADRAGVTVEGLEAAITGNPGAVTAAIREVEATVAPELVALYQAELDAKVAILKSDETEPTWMRAWRPLGMYLVMFLWLWNFVILHVANAIWKIALPVPDTVTLMQLTTLYFTLLMGGHTVKAVVQEMARK